MDLFHSFKSAHVSVICRSAESLILELAIPETFPYFEGHFTGNPILPAAMAVEMSAWLVTTMLSTSESFVIRKVERSKFSENIRPNEPFCIELTVIADRCFRSRWLRCDGGVAADIRFTLG